MIFITTVHFVIRILMKVKHFHFDVWCDYRAIWSQIWTEIVVWMACLFSTVMNLLSSFWSKGAFYLTCIDEDEAQWRYI